METPTSRSLLVVEDDQPTAAFLADNLAADGFRVSTAAGLAAAWRALEARPPDIVLLDIALGDGSGLELLDRLRAADSTGSQLDPALPVIVLSGRGSELDRVRGFDRGADDYLAKPFAYRELLARVRAVLRRADAHARRGAIRVGGLTIDPLARTTSLEGEPIALSSKEFSLLYALAREPTRVHTKADLLRDVWGYLAPGSTRTLDTHACRLRKKLSGGPRRFVITARGVGYKLTETP
jgi:DNA-binding response OmpR family regulator